MESKPKCEPKPTTACQCRKAYKFEFEFNPFMTVSYRLPLANQWLANGLVSI